jgi:hypothetical protein
VGLNTAHIAVSHARIFLKCAGQATSKIDAIFYVGASRPQAAWGTQWPGGVWDEVWLNGVPVDWSWMKANNYTESGEPNHPTTQPVLILFDNKALNNAPHQIKNYFGNS